MSEAKLRSFERVLTMLAEDGYTWGDLVEWVSCPSSGRQADCWAGLFRARTQVSRILDLWASKGSRDGRRQVHEWAVGYLEKVVNDEAQRVTCQGILQSRRLNIDDTFLRTFDLASVHARVRAMCPTMDRLMQSFSTTNRQRKEEKREITTEEERILREKRRERKEAVSCSPVNHICTTCSAPNRSALALQCQIC